MFHFDNSLDEKPQDRLLHVGCGWGKLPDDPAFAGLKEVRLDIERATSPDILASATDMGDIGTFKVVYACHVMEHLFPHEVPVALKEFHRVLEMGGACYIQVPDLEDVRPTNKVLVNSAAGPVAGLDMYYGFRPAMKVLPYMAHHTGFVSETLEQELVEAGFKPIVQRLPDYNLLGIGLKV